MLVLRSCPRAPSSPFLRQEPLVPPRFWERADERFGSRTAAPQWPLPLALTPWVGLTQPAPHLVTYLQACWLWNSWWGRQSVSVPRPEPTGPFALAHTHAVAGTSREREELELTSPCFWRISPGLSSSKYQQEGKEPASLCSSGGQILGEPGQPGACGGRGRAGSCWWRGKVGHLPEQVVGLAGSQMLAAGPPAPHASGGDFKCSDSFAGPEGAACTRKGRGASVEGRGAGRSPQKQPYNEGAAPSEGPKCTGQGQPICVCSVLPGSGLDLSQLACPLMGSDPLPHGFGALCKPCLQPTSLC